MTALSADASALYLTDCHVRNLKSRIIEQSLEGSIGRQV